VACKGYNLIPIAWDDTIFHKNEVITEIKRLKEFAETGNEMPIFFFGDGHEDFSFSKGKNFSF